MSNCSGVTTVSSWGGTVGGPDSLTRVQEGHLIVERGREDSAEDALERADAGRANPGLGEMGNPFPDVGGHDLVHLQRAEPRHDVLADRVGVTFPGGHLDHVVGQPLPLDVPLEGLLPAPWVTQAALSQPDFSGLPCVVGVLLVAEGPGVAGLPAGIAVVRGVPVLALQAGALPRPSHKDHPVKIF
jgi:hypothetical protein